MSRAKQWSIEGGVSSRPRPRTVLGLAEVNTKGLPKIVSFQDAKKKHSHDISASSFDPQFMKYVRSRCPFPTTPMLVMGSYSQGGQSMLQHASPDSTLSTQSIDDAFANFTTQEYDKSEWKERKDRSGRTFYVNRNDGRLSWTMPRSTSPIDSPASAVEEEVHAGYGLVLPDSSTSPKHDSAKRVLRKHSPRVLEAGERVSWTLGTHIVLRSDRERRRTSQTSNATDSVTRQSSLVSENSTSSLRELAVQKFHRDYLRGLKLNFPPLDAEKVREGILSPNLNRDRKKSKQADDSTALTPYGYLKLSEEPATARESGDHHGKAMSLEGASVEQEEMSEGRNVRERLRAAIIDHFHAGLYAEPASNSKLLQQEIFRNQSLNDKLQLVIAVQVLRSCYDAGAINQEAFRALKTVFLDDEHYSTCSTSPEECRHANETSCIMVSNNANRRLVGNDQASQRPGQEGDTRNQRRWVKSSSRCTSLLSFFEKISSCRRHGKPWQAKTFGCQHLSLWKIQRDGEVDGNTCVFPPLEQVMMLVVRFYSSC
eukprot:761439-Hanusia_phi.AAC.1